MLTTGHPRHPSHPDNPHSPDHRNHAHHPTHPSTSQLPRRRPERGLLGLIRRRPVVTFFVLANALSWIAWLPYILSLNGIGVWNVEFPPVLGSSQVLGVLPGAYLGPIGSALLVTAIVDGRAGLRRWAGRLLKWRVSWRWYAIALLSVPLGMIIAGWVFAGGVIQAPSLMMLAAYVPMLAFQMLTTGLAEEPGWRDFALARMQHTLGPLRSAVILGPLWAVWHLPLFLTEWGGWPDATWTRPLVFMLFCIAFNVVMSWVFNRTGESLPLSMLMHVSANTFASSLAVEMFPTLDAEAALLSMTAAAVVAAAALLILTRGRLGYTGPVAPADAEAVTTTEAVAPTEVVETPAAGSGLGSGS